MSALPILQDETRSAFRTRGQPVGRLQSYALRVSLLEQCPYRCSYCLPGSVQAFHKKKQWLTADEHALLAPLFKARGVRKIRFTGGEPLARKDCADIIGVYREAFPAAELALTTNAQTLDEHLHALKEAGLDRLTVHLDTLKPDRYETLMGGKELRRVMAATVAAAELFEEVKINCVVQKDKNVDELSDFLAFSEKHQIQVRFIELMNTGSAGDYVEQTFFSGDDIIAALAAQGNSIENIARLHPSDPARLLKASGTTFGIIASDTQSFCSDCDRLRLTAFGSLKGCLYEPEGIDLKKVLRTDAAPSALNELLDARLGQALDDKRSFHPTMAIDQRPFSMADIGG